MWPFFSCCPQMSDVGRLWSQSGDIYRSNQGFQKISKERLILPQIVFVCFPDAFAVKETAWQVRHQDQDCARTSIAKAYRSTTSTSKVCGNHRRKHIYYSRAVSSPRSNNHHSSSQKHFLSSLLGICAAIATTHSSVVVSSWASLFWKQYVSIIWGLQNTGSPDSSSGCLDLSTLRLCSSRRALRPKYVQEEAWVHALQNWMFFHFWMFHPFLHKSYFCVLNNFVSSLALCRQHINNVERCRGFRFHLSDAAQMDTSVSKDVQFPHWIRNRTILQS